MIHTTYDDYLRTTYRWQTGPDQGQPRAVDNASMREVIRIVAIRPGKATDCAAAMLTQ